MKVIVLRILLPLAGSAAITALVTSIVPIFTKPVVTPNPTGTVMLLIVSFIFLFSAKSVAGITVRLGLVFVLGGLALAVADDMLPIGLSLICSGFIMILVISSLRSRALKYPDHKFEDGIHF